MDIQFINELKYAYEQILKNPGITDEEQMNIAYNAACQLSKENLKYIAAIGIVLAVKTTIYEEYINESLIPSVICKANKLTKNAEKETRSKNAKNAADKRHDQPGGARDKQRQMIEYWQSGEFKTRDDCAEQMHDRLKLSFSAARKALNNIQKSKSSKC